MNSNSAVRFKPALTKDELITIQKRSAKLSDVRMLQWEVVRLLAGAANA